MKGTIRKSGENNLGLFPFHIGGQCRLQAAFFPLETEGISQKMSIVIATRAFVSSLATLAVLPVNGCELRLIILPTCSDK